MTMVCSGLCIPTFVITANEESLEVAQKWVQYQTAQGEGHGMVRCWHFVWGMTWLDE
jgi:hypothetical protein